MAKPIISAELSSEEKFWQRVDRSGGPDACWTWTSAKNRNGYGKVWFSGRVWAAHRLSAFFAGMTIDGACVLHHCDNPPCCNQRHLFVGTRTDNSRDAVQKGRIASGDKNGSRTHPEALVRGDDHWTRTNPEKVARGETHYLRINPELSLRGEANAAAKLKEEHIREIRCLYAKGVSQTHIARQYGVSQPTISMVVNRKMWPHVVTMES